MSNVIRFHSKRANTMQKDPMMLIWKILAMASMTSLAFIGGVHFLSEKKKPLTCPQVIRELEQSERLSELRAGWVREERERANEYQKLARELLRERGLPDNLPALPPARE